MSRNCSTWPGTATHFPKDLVCPIDILYITLWSAHAASRKKTVAYRPALFYSIWLGTVTHFSKDLVCPIDILYITLWSAHAASRKKRV